MFTHRKHFIFIAVLFVGAIAIAISLTTPFITQAQSSNPNSHSITYEYDSAGRLIRATYGDQIQIRYIYDSAGNLLRREVVDAQTAVRSWYEHD